MSPAAFQRLTDALRSILSEQSPARVLTRVVADLRALIYCDDVAIWELKNGDTLEVTAADGTNTQTLQNLTIAVGDGITGTAVEQQQLIVANNAHKDPRARHIPGTPRDPEAILCVPLSARSNRLGALTLYRRGDNRPFTDAEAELANQFADIAAISLDNARAVTALEELASTDDLTKLANRRHFYRQLEHEIALAERHKTPLTLLLIDLDKFKDINDLYGHQRGDHVLQHIAAAIRQHTRHTDTAARIGGDEFAVILPQTPHSAAHSFAERLTTTISATINPSIRISVGVAAYAGNPHTLFHDADQHLYANKRRLAAVPATERLR